MAEYVQRRWVGNFDGPSRLARKPCLYQAYVPDSLADREIGLTEENAAAVSDAERAVLRLNNLGSATIGLEALARRLLRAEAVASSKIEMLGQPVLQVRLVNPSARHEFVESCNQAPKRPWFMARKTTIAREDEPEVGLAGQDAGSQKRQIIRHVLGNNRSSFRLGKGKDDVVRLAAKLGMLGNRLDVVPAQSKLNRRLRRPHLVEEQLHRSSRSRVRR